MTTRWRPGAVRALIDRFEASPQHHEVMREGDVFSFTQIKVDQAWPDVDQEVQAILRRAFRQYENSLEIGKFWPAVTWLEGIRLKRYLPGGQDRFNPHVDVMDESTSRRLVTAILYLNAPGGGQTNFPQMEVSVFPKIGRLVIFPPLWTFVHAGLPPLDRPQIHVTGLSVVSARAVRRRRGQTKTAPEGAVFAKREFGSGLFRPTTAADRGNTQDAGAKQRERQRLGHAQGGRNEIDLVIGIDAGGDEVGVDGIGAARPGTPSNSVWKSKLSLCWAKEVVPSAGPGNPDVSKYSSAAMGPVPLFPCSSVIFRSPPIHEKE